MHARLVDNSNALLAACKKDLNKGAFEAGLVELDWCTNDCIFVSTNLEKWAKDESAPDIALTHALLRPKIRKDPMGLVLIIGYVQVNLHCLAQQTCLTVY